MVRSSSVSLPSSPVCITLTNSVLSANIFIPFLPCFLITCDLCWAMQTSAQSHVGHHMWSLSAVKGNYLFLSLLPTLWTFLHVWLSPSIADRKATAWMPSKNPGRWYQADLCCQHVLLTLSEASGRFVKHEFPSQNRGDFFAVPYLSRRLLMLFFIMVSSGLASTGYYSGVLNICPGVLLKN